MDTVQVFIEWSIINYNCIAIYYY